MPEGGDGLQPVGRQLEPGIRLRFVVWSWGTVVCLLRTTAAVHSPFDFPQDERMGWELQDERMGWEREDERMGWEREDERMGWA